jgi:hydroxymethylbilane synthase
VPAKKTSRDPSIILIATRPSDLARRQARIVANALQANGVESELLTFKTTGDKKFDEPLTEIRAEGLFTAELEKALEKGKVDCCVHSLDVLAAESPSGLEIAAVLERTDPRDAVVINKRIEAEGLDDLPPGSRVGISSLVRRAQLLALRSDLEVVELRGNLPTRLKKLDGGQVHASIFAAAGLLRLGARDRIKKFLDAPDWLPPAGQGAIAVQIRAEDERMRALVAPLNYQPTSIATRAERAFVAALDGGGQMPIGALCIASEGKLILYGMLADISGREILRGEQTIDPAHPENAGELLAADIRSRGGNTLLAALRELKSVPAPQPE